MTSDRSQNINKPLNIWHYKPWWCQPWSILLTGSAIVWGSWWLAKTPWFTVVVAVPVLAWMGFFLLVYPRLMADYYSDAVDIGEDQ
jgi:hypothetical protein